MKTMLLAAAATLALGVGAAYAGDGEGGTATAAQWDAFNGIQHVPADEYFAHQQYGVPGQQQHAATTMGTPFYRPYGGDNG